MGNQNKMASRFEAMDALEDLTDDIFLKIRGGDYSRVLLKSDKYRSHYCQTQLLGKIFRKENLNVEVIICSNGMSESFRSEDSYFVDVDNYVQKYLRERV